MRVRAKGLDRFGRRVAHWVEWRVSGRLIPLLGLVSALGCGERVTSQTFVEPSSQRPYRVVVPVGHDPKRATGVLFALHAYSIDPDDLPRSWSLVAKAVEARGYLLVVPSGQKDDDGNWFWNASAACCGNAQHKPDDVAYLRGVLRDVASRFAVDRERVYAVGVSNGAFMAHRWACTPGGDLRGIVAVSGMGPGVADPACAPSVPVRVLQVHGDADALIHYEGFAGGQRSYPSAWATVARWCELNHCAVPASEEQNWSLLHGHTRTWRALGSAAEVRLWTFEGGGHQLRSLRFAVPQLLDFLENG